MRSTGADPGGCKMGTNTTGVDPDGCKAHATPPPPPFFVTPHLKLSWLTTRMFADFTRRGGGGGGAEHNQHN